MIHLLRPSPPPEFIARASTATKELSAVAAQGGYKAQRGFKTNLRIRKLAAPLLLEASSGKCAYCETRIHDRTTEVVDNFRPVSRAEGLDKGDIAPDHYWWLSYTWENLVATCPTCNRSKRNRFPVEGSRLQPGDPVEQELSLLLDPYGADDPDEHLWFDADGTVRPLSDRGECTIEVLALDRPSLVVARRAAAAELELHLLSAGGSLGAAATKMLTGPEVEYLALRRQLLARHAEGSQRTLAAGNDRRERVVFVPNRAVDTVPGDLGAVWIEEIDIVDFGCVRRLELRFSAPTVGFEPWIVLLGANGAGKSTILKAVALALASQADRRRLVPDAAAFLNRETGSRRGHVRVRFNRGEEVLLHVRSGDPEFRSEGQRPHFAVAGYGSTRLLPRRRAKASSARAVGPKLVNLFDPWAHLADAEQWLADTDRVSADQFRMLATSLKTLMSVADEIELSRRMGRLYTHLFGTRLDLAELSAGYQSILAFALDLSLAFSSEFGQGASTENFEGMVLLDELETHLHPAWKARVVSDLRAVFPHLQFIATTHDPLCLRGLQPGEIHLLERTGEGIFIDQIDIPSGLDADEILTGTWFGLETTYDEQVERDLLDYRSLRMRYGPDAPEVAELRARLGAVLGSYAGTSLGRVMVEAAGELVAEQAPRPPGDQLTSEQIRERLLAHARERLQ